jgi:hypothetical protein
VASFIFPSHQNVQDDPFSRKSHGICFWDRKGFLLVDFMPKGTTINAEAYCNTLKKLRRAIQNRRMGMLTRGVSLLHDNAKPHTAPVLNTQQAKIFFVILVGISIVQNVDRDF